jgi:hypothetical protein
MLDSFANKQEELPFFEHPEIENEKQAELYWKSMIDRFVCTN